MDINLSSIQRPTSTIASPDGLQRTQAQDKFGDVGEKSVHSALATSLYATQSQHLNFKMHKYVRWIFLVLALTKDLEITGNVFNGDLADAGRRSI